MNTRILNISFAIFWFVLLVGLLTREWWMPPVQLAVVENPQMPLIIGILVVMTMWNLSRYWTSQRPGPPKSQITEEMRAKIRDITGHDHKVTDPQLNFEDADKPSQN